MKQARLHDSSSRAEEKNSMLHRGCVNGRPEQSFPALKSVLQLGLMTHLPAVNMDTNSFPKHQLHVSRMAELDSHPHDQIHALIRWGAFTELGTAVHGRVPRGFCSHLPRQKEHTFPSPPEHKKASQGNSLAWLRLDVLVSMEDLLELASETPGWEDVASITLVWAVRG